MVRFRAANKVLHELLFVVIFSLYFGALFKLYSIDLQCSVGLGVGSLLVP
jgi:hypothetical protein